MHAEFYGLGGQSFQPTWDQRFQRAFEREVVRFCANQLERLLPRSAVPHQLELDAYDDAD